MFKFIISDYNRVLEALELIIKSGDYTMQSHVKNNKVYFVIYVNTMKYILSFNIIATDNMHRNYKIRRDNREERNDRKISQNDRTSERNRTNNEK